MKISKLTYAVLALVTGLCPSVPAEDNPISSDIDRAIRSGHTNIYSRSLFAHPRQGLPLEMRLEFTPTQDGGLLTGEKTTWMRITGSSGSHSHDLLRIPLWTPNDVPSSYEVGYDEATRTLIVAFLGQRSGCVVYEIELPREQGALSPAVISSLHADIEPQQKGKIKTTRSVVTFPDYDKYVSRHDKVQRLKPTKVIVDKGTVALSVLLPSQSGAVRSSVEVILSKPVGDSAGRWKVEKVATPSVEAQRCYQNLGRIQAAKEQWSMAEHKKAGDALVLQQVDEYIKDGHPKCPDGGEYVYGVIGEAPKCTIHGVSE